MTQARVVTQTRDFLQIGPIQVRHSTAARDWVCGTCGSKLVTRYYADRLWWRTECAQNSAHDDQKFVHKSTWEYLEHREYMDTAQAREVFEHLPAELQAAIQAAE